MKKIKSLLQETVMSNGGFFIMCNKTRIIQFFSEIKYNLNVKEPEYEKTKL